MSTGKHTGTGTGTAPRTEEEKVLQAPLKIILGGTEHDVKPLVIRDSRAWREKVSRLMGDIPKHTKPDTNDPDGFQSAMESLMVAAPNTIINLVFEYAVDLDRDEIEATATDHEMGEAFYKILEFAFPLTKTLTAGVR
jgi:hypothetical protein